MSYPEGRSGIHSPSTAELMLSVAEAGTSDDLGTACSGALSRFTGSGVVGIYLIDAGQPQLLCSSKVKNDFLEDYRSGLGNEDPYVEHISTSADILDGPGFYGRAGWPRSRSFDFLQSWGYYSHMCGPLLQDGKAIGVLYTATDQPDRPYSPHMKEGMALLCRAASLALNRVLTAVPTDVREFHLPQRQAEVAQLIRQGCTNKAMARELGLSEHTVKEYVAILCRRFDVRNRTELSAVIERTNVGRTAPH